MDSIKLTALLGLLILCLSTEASEILNAKITRLMIDRNHGAIVFIQTDGVSDRTPGAGCHTNSTWDYVSDLTDTAGQEIYSTLLAAKVSQETISLRGKGQSVCDLHSSIESLSRVEY